MKKGGVPPFFILIWIILFHYKLAHSVVRFVAHADEIHATRQAAYVEAHLGQAIGDVVFHRATTHVDDSDFGAACKGTVECQGVTGWVGVEAQELLPVFTQVFSARIEGQRL